MFKCNSAKFLLLSLLACTDRLPTAETKDSIFDNPKVVQLNSLFLAVIGRGLNPNEDKINKTASNLLKDKSYEEQVEDILNSQQFIDEGFFHFHQQRMSLLERLDTGIIEIFSPLDFEALRLELKELADKKNYWDILTYRHRYLPIDDLSSSGGAKLECKGTCKIDNVKKEIIKIINNEFDKNIYYPYRDRCCKKSENEGTYITKTPEERHAEFCAIAMAFTSSVFSEAEGKFCSLDSSKISEEDNNKNSSDEELHRAINFYLSLYLGIRTDKWFLATLQSLSPIAFNGSHYLKVEFPKELQGIHASPFWLWRHRTSPQNQHLRRASIIYHSWFCGVVSPDQARPTNVQPNAEEVDKFKAYFDENDQHATGDANCFGCHKEVQPLANYFGKLAGYPPVESDNFYGLGAKFLARPEDRLVQSDGSDRLAGYWEDGEFYGGFKGLAGLAESLPKIPKVYECLVNSAWNTLLGSDLPQLTSEEVSDAINKFKTTGNDYKQLLKHLLLTDKATTFFTEGRKKMVKNFANESSCSEKVFFDDVKPIITNSCATAGCHNDNGYRVFEDDFTFSGSENKLQEVYNKVNNETMPPHYAKQLEDSEKTDLECYLLENGAKDVTQKSAPPDSSHKIVEAE